MFRVDATRPPTFTWALAPNSTPFGLTRNTWPLAERLPRMLDGLDPVTRLRATELLFGWANDTDSPWAMPKLCQSRIAFWLVCLMVIDAPELATVAAPATTEPPVGRAWAAEAMASVLAAPKRALRASAPRPGLGSRTIDGNARGMNLSPCFSGRARVFADVHQKDLTSWTQTSLDWAGPGRPVASPSEWA